LLLCSKAVQAMAAVAKTLQTWHLSCCGHDGQQWRWYDTMNTSIGLNTLDKTISARSLQEQQSKTETKMRSSATRPRPVNTRPFQPDQDKDW